MHPDLDRFFNPQAIAIIGASQDLATISGQPLKFLQSHGYRGALYPVNPRYEEILGVRCYPALAEVPGAPDLALVLVNAARVPDVLVQCGEKGVAFAIVYSSGFAEMGEAGAARQAELVAIAQRYGMGLIGPNCQGMMNVAGRVFAGFGSVFNQDYEPGGMSMVSQSGGFGFSVMNLSAKEGGLPVRQIVTTGNEAGVSTPDFIAHYLRDPGTELIAVYVEGLRNARRLLDIGEEALVAGKPVMMWKAGVTAHAQRASRAHTANPSGAPELYRAAFNQRGILAVEDIQDVIDYGRALRCGRLPRGNRVGIITISGGAGILMTDECIARGLELPALSPHTTEQLRAFVPPFGSLLNPVDVTAAIFNQTDLVGRALEAVLNDPAVDSVVMINASLQGDLATTVAAQIVEGAARTDKPLFIAWSAREAVSAEAYAMLDAARIPHYRSPVRCARAIAALSWYAQARRRRERERAEALPVLGVPSARAALAKAGDLLTGAKAKRIFAEYGITGASAGVPVREGAAARGGIEVKLAAVNDPEFGPAVRLALGGAPGIVSGQAAWRLGPVTAGAAREMIEELPGARLLTGTATQQPVDLAALIDAVVRLSAMAVDLQGCMAEAGFDALRVMPAGGGLRIGNAWIRARRG